MKRILTDVARALAGATALALLGAPAAAQVKMDVPLIPRETLFGNPEKTQARISPDGAYISYLAPVDGVMNVWVAPADDPSAAKPVTDDEHRGIRNHSWAFTNEHIIYAQDEGGDENYNVFLTNVETGETKNLTPYDNVQARVLAVSHRRPNEIVVAVNNRMPQFHDVHLVDLRTGESRVLEENPGVMGDGMVVNYVVDDDYDVRFAFTLTQEGGARMWHPVEGEDVAEVGPWVEWMDIPQTDILNTAPIGFDKSGRLMYMLDSRRRDTAALVTIDTVTKKREVLAENERADLSGAMIHPTEKNIEAANFTYARREWIFFDDEVRKDFQRLGRIADGEIDVVSRTIEDDKWIVAFEQDDGPIRYYVYERPSGETTFLFTHRPALEGLPLAEMHDVVIEARDGLKLVSYLTLPVGVDEDDDMIPDAGPVPMVLLVHGGPWARDSWGYNAYHQLLANRGYAVLSVNYRGSTGFGKEFINAAKMEFAGKMHDDLIDAVEWSIAEGVAEPDRIGIMGGSYGGYATLVGLTFTPEVFACGVDIVGPSNLITLMESFPAYWGPAIDIWKTRVGDFTTEEGREFLLSRSPISRVDAMQRPLLIGQGANDPRVKQSESDQIVQAMQEKDIPVTYVLFPDEGHGFARPENSMAFNAVTEAFLHQHLGGRYEPIDDAFEGSTIEVPEGADLIPGVAESLPQGE